MMKRKRHRYYRKYNDRRKFRSQTSDNMDRLKAEQGKGREKRKISREKIRRERVRRQKIQMREKVMIDEVVVGCKAARLATNMPSTLAIAIMTRAQIVTIANGLSLCVHWCASPELQRHWSLRNLLVLQLVGSAALSTALFVREVQGLFVRGWFAGGAELDLSGADAFGLGINSHITAGIEITVST